MPLFFLPMPPSRCPLLLFFTLSLAISLSLPFQNAGACSWSVFLTLKTGGVSHRREAEGEGVREEATMAAGLCNMQNRALVAKVSGLRWGVSAARVHWCMNAAKSNASLDRQEGVGKVRAACRGRAAVQGATFPSFFPPSLPPSLFLSCLFVFFVVAFQLFIYLFFSVFLHLQLRAAAEFWCHGGGHSPNKTERSQRASDWNKATQRSYSENISISLRNTN